MAKKVEVVVAVSIYHRFEDVVHTMCSEFEFKVDKSRPCLHVLSGTIPEDRIDELWELEGVDLVQRFSLQLPEVDC